MKFETNVMEVEYSIDHGNADKLSIVKLKGYNYNIVSGKLDDGSHRYKTGDIVVYVQTDSLVPTYLLQRYGYWNEEKSTGLLSGSKGNRVKHKTIRGVLSEGILFPTEILSIRNENDEKLFVNVGDDLSEFLGITKYEPPLPIQLSGDVIYIGQENTLHFDIENAKKYPNIIDSYNDEIFLTEKRHGSFVAIGYLPNYENEELFHVDGMPGSFYVCSKGLGSKGLVFKNNTQNRENNSYVKTVLEMNLFEKLATMAQDSFIFMNEVNHKAVLLGEMFGNGVQDLKYNQPKPTFEAFDFNIDGNYLDAYLKYSEFKYFDIPHVPVLAIVNKEEEIYQYVDGECVGGGNIREGVVAVTGKEYHDYNLGRTILKYVSDAYLNRKGNTTEFQ